MKTLVLFMALVAGVATAQEGSLRLVDPSVQARLAFDSNPVGTAGPSARAMGSGSSGLLALSAAAGLAIGKAGPAEASAKMIYTAESTHFDRWSSEDFS